MLAVTDTGAGIDPSIMDKIYEPFFTTKPPGQGTGLGLASTHTIVKEAGGHIWVYSEPGQGTTFKVYFPWERASKASPSPSSTPAELRMLGTAFLVEDDARVRRAVRRMLERIGFDVLEASDGEAGLGMAAGHDGPIDVVVTDLMMPRLGGGAFARAARAVATERAGRVHVGLHRRRGVPARASGIRIHVRPEAVHARAPRGGDSAGDAEGSKYGRGVADGPVHGTAFVVSRTVGYLIPS